MQKLKPLFGSKEDIEKQIEEHRPDGWKPKGEMVVLPHDTTDNSETPKFVYFSQDIVKED
jgi:hypothetical protein